MDRLNRSVSELSEAMANAGLNAAQAAPVAHVAVKLPPFWEPNPEVWFLQAEAAFRSNVTRQTTMYDHVLGALPPTVVTGLLDLVAVADEHPDDIYTRVKERVMGKFTLTRWARAAAVVKGPDLGDRRPSTLMDEMLAVHPVGEKPATLFLYLFLMKLPADMMDHLTKDDYAAIAADRLWDSRQARGAVASSYPVSALVTDLAAATLSSPRASSPSRRADRQRPQGRRDQSRRRQTPRRSSLCRLHERWGEDAHNCIPPCSWDSKNGQRSGRRN